MVMVTPVLSLLMMMKFLVHLLVKIRFGSKARLMPGCDCFQLMPNLGKNYNSRTIIRNDVLGKIPFKDLKERFRARLVELRNSDGSLANAKLKWRIKDFLGYKVYFEDEESFDINKHIEIIADDSGDFKLPHTGIPIASVKLNNCFRYYGI